MKSLISLALAALLLASVAEAKANSDVQAETQRLIRTFERRFRTEGRGYFRSETDLHRWMLTTRDVVREARQARLDAGLPVAPPSKITATIERHCQIVSPACVAAVLVLTSRQ